MEAVHQTQGHRWTLPEATGESPRGKEEGNARKVRSDGPGPFMWKGGSTYQQFAELLIIEHFVFVLFGQLLAQGDGLLPHLRGKGREKPKPESCGQSVTQ